MSNNNGNVRVITLKKIEPPKREEQDKQNMKKAELEAFQQKIDQLKQKLLQLEEKKEEMLKQVQAEIEQEKLAWLEQKELEKQRAQKEGFEAGFEQGKNEALNEYRALLEKANEIVQLANEDYHRTVKKHEEAIIRLAIRSAEKIIHEKLQERPDRFVTIVQKAIEDLQDRSQISIYVSPHDYPNVIDQKEELEQLIEEDDLLSIYNKPDLKEGSCTIQHPFGQLDISIDAQLSELKHALVQYVLEND